MAHVVGLGYRGVTLRGSSLKGGLLPQLLEELPADGLQFPASSSDCLGCDSCLTQGHLPRVAPQSRNRSGCRGRSRPRALREMTTAVRGSSVAAVFSRPTLQPLCPPMPLGPRTLSINSLLGKHSPQGAQLATHPWMKRVQEAVSGPPGLFSVTQCSPATQAILSWRLRMGANREHRACGAAVDWDQRPSNACALALGVPPFGLIVSFFLSLTNH